jgi:hypothetical protein
MGQCRQTKGRVTVAAAFRERAGLTAEGLDCQIAETAGRRPCRSGRANVKASIGDVYVYEPQY